MESINDDKNPALPYTPAPAFPIPDKKYFVIEYPGVVKDLPRALKTLDGIHTINKNYNQKDPTWGLKFRPEDPFCHPIRGHTVETRNFLLKITRKVLRKKKTSESASGPSHPEWSHVLSIDYSIIGLIEKTVRFRSFADFYHRPSEVLAEKLTAFHNAMENLDIQNLSQSFNLLNDFFGENAEKEEEMVFVPPPLFSRNTTPFHYKYQQVEGLKKDLAKENPFAPGASVAINTLKRQRSKTSSKFLSFSFTDLVVPPGPSEEILKVSKQISRDILEKGRKLFDERPIWTRPAFLNQFDSITKKDIKLIFPALAYNLVDGPWLMVWVRYGYDPRTDPVARIYQTVRTRKLSSLTVRSKVRHDTTYNENTCIDPTRERTFHIFDPKKVPTQILTYQICDINYPRIDPYVKDTKFLNETPHPRYGWFRVQVYKKIHSLVAQKSQMLLKSAEKKNKDTGECMPSIPDSLDREGTKTTKQRVKNSDEGSDTDIEELVSRDEHAWTFRTPTVHNNPSFTPLFPAPSSEIPGSIEAYLFSSAMDTSQPSFPVNQDSDILSDQLNQLKASLVSNPDLAYSEPSQSEQEDNDNYSEDDFDDNISVCGSTLEYMDRSDDSLFEEDLQSNVDGSEQEESDDSNIAE